ncbi:MAG TPA: GntG family PLP-dependent aldolase [Myxococcales bacterium]|nr:GntG family PLP-dependent aldolase [Myxococcales bacterium]
MDLLDLRSDTVTKPGPAMRKAMAEAEVGDDVFGEDPTVNRLQDRVAEILGKEAALFVPTGTMANQTAIGAQVGPGDEIICDQGCHAANYEGGGLAALWGAQIRALAGKRGLLDAALVEEAIRPPNDHHPRSRLVEVENTHNRGGGTVYPLAQVQAIAEVARRRSLKLHLDGARLWNACVKTGVAPAAYAAHADTVSVCLSKGLGAPAGSLVAGSRELVATARRLRKRLGGGMRQAGVLAAAGLYALEHHRERLAEDHENARRLAQEIAAVPGLRVALDSVETNLIFAEVVREGWNAARAVAALREHGVLAGDADGKRLRFVTHLDFPTSAVGEAAKRIATALRA